jgi:hypothetical protein
MLNAMQFHQMLGSSSAHKIPLLQALKSFTSLNLARLKALTAGLGWEPW